MSLVDLPTELLQLISSNLEYVSDLNALSKSYPRLYGLLHDNIYEFLPRGRRHSASLGCGDRE